VLLPKQGLPLGQGPEQGKEDTTTPLSLPTPLLKPQPPVNQKKKKKKSKKKKKEFKKKVARVA
jgi:hypothetical protein